VTGVQTCALPIFELLRGLTHQKVEFVLVGGMAAIA
jgi:hypothetical protein